MCTLRNIFLTFIVRSHRKKDYYFLIWYVKNESTEASEKVTFLMLRKSVDVCNI